jgi:uncharacterized protein YcfJ
MPKLFPTLPLAALAFVAAPAVQAQNYADLPPLAPLPDAQVQQLPADMRTAPTTVQPSETVTTENGVETITRTRRIDAPRPLPAPQAQAYPAYGYAAPVAYGPAPAVFEREQWLDECRRRTAGQDRDDAGLIIGGLLGAITGGIVGYEIAGAGDRVLGTVLGVGGGGLIGGLLGSLFDGDDEEQYDCEAALDAYLSQYGTPIAPVARIASREIAYPYPAAQPYSYGYPATYAYGTTYAPPPQMVMVPVRTEVQQQVVVRETVREETYTVPGASREIPAPAPRPLPSPKMIKQP